MKTLLAENPRFQVHLTPTSDSWLNLVEVWFGIIERQALHRADVTSVIRLNKIRAFFLGWNDRFHTFMGIKTNIKMFEKSNRPTTSKTDH